MLGRDLPTTDTPFSFSLCLTFPSIHPIPFTVRPPPPFNAPSSVFNAIPPSSMPPLHFIVHPLLPLFDAPSSRFNAIPPSSMPPVPPFHSPPPPSCPSPPTGPGAKTINLSRRKRERAFEKQPKRLTAGETEAERNRHRERGGAAGRKKQKKESEKE